MVSSHIVAQSETLGLQPSTRVLSVPCAVFLRATRWSLQLYFAVAQVSDGNVIDSSNFSKGIF